jgi:hypothetical protein
MTAESALGIDYLREIERRREAQGLLPAGWNEPVYFEDFLVEVWRLASVLNAGSHTRRRTDSSCSLACRRAR